MSRPKDVQQQVTPGKVEHSVVSYDRARVLHVRIVATACAVSAIDVLSIIVGFATWSPDLFIAIAVLPPLVGTFRWPLIALSLSRAKTRRAWYAIPIMLFVVYVLTAVVVWNLQAIEYRQKFVDWYTSYDVFFWLTTLHMLLHLGCWAWVGTVIVRDLCQPKQRRDLARTQLAFLSAAETESAQPACSNCGYSLTGVPATGRCPECSMPIGQMASAVVRQASKAALALGIASLALLIFLGPFATLLAIPAIVKGRQVIKLAADTRVTPEAVNPAKIGMALGWATIALSALTIVIFVAMVMSKP